MLTGDQLVYVTARAAMAFYFATLLVRLLVDNAARRTSWRRRLGTVGLAIYLLHVAAAFQFVHRWSHAAALAATARRTAEETGFASGVGLYFNYLFTLVWTVDVAWQWLSPTSYARRSRSTSWLIDGFTFFMVFNAVVVFGHGPTRWLGAAACAVLIAVGLRSIAARSRQSSIV
jgi:hypothetical protein